MASGSMAPRGKPTTQQVLTSLPASFSWARGTQQVLTQTEAKWYSRASSQSFSIWARVALALSRVWSIMRLSSMCFSLIRCIPFECTCLQARKRAAACALVIRQDITGTRGHKEAALAVRHNAERPTPPVPLERTPRSGGEAGTWPAQGASRDARQPGELSGRRPQ